ncbi:MAG: hypothetical protein Q9M37_10250 [Desulfonauticus sp.]|nr:hypothetical protein [Desulfonauticus sp.]
MSNYSRKRLHPLLKAVLLACIFAGTGYLFWKNYEHSLKKIQNKQSVWDQTKTLTEEQKQTLYDLIDFFKQNYELNVYIKITKDEMYLPKINKHTIFIGLCPKQEKVFVRFPPLMEKALGVKFLRYLQEKYFQGHFSSEQWPRRLVGCLKLIQKKVLEIESG